MALETADLTQRARIRVAFIGWGAINSRVGALLDKRSAPVKIVGIATASARTAVEKIPADITSLSSPAMLVSLKPDLVVEALAAPRSSDGRRMHCTPRER